MDKDAMVKSAHALIDSLEEKGHRPKFVMWVHKGDSDTWKLWLKPDKDLADQQQFYRTLSSIMADEPFVELGITAGDVEFLPQDHLASKSVASVIRSTGKGSITMSQNVLNGFLIPDGILVRSEQS
jgi:hypothetical protein